ncbi:MAG: outer membrane protein assembly factor BamA [Alphaproteobacteria bacterium]
MSIDKSRLLEKITFSKNKFCNLIFHLFLFLFIFNSPSFSQNNIDNFLIINGLSRTDEISVKQFFENLKIDKNLETNLNKITKEMLTSELFDSVEIKYINKKIYINLTENPIIFETKFIGNKKIDDEILQAEISLKKRSVFSQSKLQSDLKRIQNIYLKSGRFLTKIETKIVPKDNNRIELIFEIIEGPKANIGEIYFIGNDNFADRELKEQISTKKTIWWKFLSNSDLYDSDRLEYDKELLRRFYNSNGFADFNIISAMAQINKNKDSFFVTFLLEEGIKYNFGEINIDNKIANFDSEILYKNILFKTGDVYSSLNIEQSIDKMMEVMSEKSYAFANIEPILKRNPKNKTIDIDFVIEETPRVYINQIKIFGNTRTIDKVIRRELRIIEGDPFNLNKINRSKQRLENLGFFEKVEINQKRMGDSNQVDVEITVKEKRTGELSLGVGFSKFDRFNINAGIRENNLFGTGRKIGLNVQRSFANVNASIDYTKPYFFDRPIDVGVNLYRTTSTKRNGRDYDMFNTGFRLNANYSITEFFDHIISYSYNNQEVGNIGSSSSIALKMLQGNYIYSAIDNSFIFDKTNNRFDPRSGYFISLSNVYNGLGGNVKNIKYNTKIGYFIPTINNDFILRFTGSAGLIQGIGQDVLIQNNFYLGGNDFRGFDFFGMGPRTINDEPLGGKRFYVGTTEFRFPLGLPRELGIYGALFWDNGVLTGVEKKLKAENQILDKAEYRSSVGLSIAWASPVGPIRLDFSKILQQAKQDRTQRFNFNLGTNF